MAMIQPDPPYTDADVEKLTAALKTRAGEPFHGVPSVGWQALTRDAIADAGITLTAEEFDRAWRACWKSSFMGGNFTADARRILDAAYLEEGASHA
jgi:hypothetical protein